MNMSGWSSEAGNPNIQDLKGKRGSSGERERERGTPPTPNSLRGGGGGGALTFKSEKMVG